MPQTYTPNKLDHTVYNQYHRVFFFTLSDLQTEDYSRNEKKEIHQTPEELTTLPCSLAQVTDGQGRSCHDES